MTTHRDDDELINEALTLGHFATKEDTVVTALRELINRCKQQQSIQMNGGAKVILGAMQDAFTIPDDFDAPLPDDILDEFYKDKL